MLRPKARFPSVTCITPQWLRERGLKAVVLDLDNTLIPYKTYGEPPTELLDWLRTLEGAGLALMLLSNAAPRRVRYWSEKLGIPGLGPAGKPWFGFGRALRCLGLKAREVAVVGDQLFTDVLGGNLVGAYTVLVPPLSKEDLGYTRLIRQIERWVLQNPAFGTGGAFDLKESPRGPTMKE